MLARGTLTSMSTHATTPGVIPYVEFHTGPRRLLTLDLTTDNSRALDRHRPIASIDGRQYVVVWGQVTWEIPADRNVHVSVHLEGDIITQTASLILPPGEGRAALRYATHYSTGNGSLS